MPERFGLPTVCETHLRLHGTGRRLCQSTEQRGCSSGRCNSGSSGIPKKRPRWERLESSDLSLESPAPAARRQVAHGIEMLVSLPRALDVHTSRSCFGWMSGHRRRGCVSPFTNAPAVSSFFQASPVPNGIGQGRWRWTARLSAAICNIMQSIWE